MGREIERKFLIEKLDESVFLSLGATKKEITQSYLVPSNDYPTRRIRKTKIGGVERYFYTEKSAPYESFARVENEWQIDLNRYLELQKERDLSLNEIAKTRYVFAQNNLTYEVDVFPFFASFDILEIELEDVSQPVTIPSFIKVIKEVSLDKAFTNQSMAREIPSLK